MKKTIKNIVVIFITIESFLLSPLLAQLAEAKLPGPEVTTTVYEEPADNTTTAETDNDLFVVPTSPRVSLYNGEMIVISGAITDFKIHRVNRSGGFPEATKVKPMPTEGGFALAFKIPEGKWEYVKNSMVTEATMSSEDGKKIPKFPEGTKFRAKKKSNPETWEYQLPNQTTWNNVQNYEASVIYLFVPAVETGTGRNKTTVYNMIVYEPSTNTVKIVAYNVKITHWGKTAVKIAWVTGGTVVVALIVWCVTGFLVTAKNH